jgi:hypothetical protein
MLDTMARSEKSEKLLNNQNAALKPGELGRVQWTDTLSGPDLLKFVRHFNIEEQVDVNDEKALRKAVADLARKMFRELLDQLPE